MSFCSITKVGAVALTIGMITGVASAKLTTTKCAHIRQSFEKDEKNIKSKLLALMHEGDIVMISSPDHRLLQNRDFMINVAVVYFCKYHPNAQGEMYVLDFNRKLYSGVVDGEVRAK